MSKREEGNHWDRRRRTEKAVKARVREINNKKETCKEEEKKGNGQKGRRKARGQKEEYRKRKWYEKTQKWSSIKGLGGKGRFRL